MDHQPAHVQEVLVTEEASDDEDDENWVGLLNMKAALKLEKALTIKQEDKSASLLETDQLSQVKLRIKELKRKEKTQKNKKEKRAREQQQFQTQPQLPPQSSMMPTPGYGSM